MSFDKRWETDIYALGRHINRYPFDHVVSTTFKYFGKTQDRSEVKILELGCGTGNNIMFFAEQGFDAIGIEGSIKAVELGREFLKMKNLKAQIDCFDFTDLSRYSDNSFDFVVDRGSITHNNRENVKKTILQVKRVLKPGGIFLSHIFSDKHKAVQFGNPLGDGSYQGFSRGFFKDHNFLFFFASEKDIKEFYHQNFKMISQLHQTTQEYLHEDLFDAMWWITCQKN